MIFFTASLALNTACHQETKDASLVVLPDHFEEKEFSLSDIAEDLLIIPLSADYPVFRFQIVAWHDSLYYYYSKDEIVRFDDMGAYVDVLSRAGRGPDEYLSCAVFLVHQGTGEIFIIDRFKIQVYDKRFNHQRTIKLPGLESIDFKMGLLNEYLHIFYYGLEKDGLLWAMTDLSGNVIKDSPAVDLYESSFLEERQVFENNGKLYRYYNKNDTIYEADSTGIRPYRLINRDFKDGFRLITEPTQYSTRESPSPYREVRSIFGLGKYWLINFTNTHYTKRNPVENESVLYDYNKNVYYLISKSFAIRGEQGSIGIKNDWAGFGYFLPFGELTIKSRKHLFRVYEASEYLALVNNEKFRNGLPSRPEIKARMISVADSLTNEDNPVLVLLKLKK